jgi:hypothetical protein
MSRTIFVPLVTALLWTVSPAMAAQPPDPQAIVRRSIEVDEEASSEILRNFIFVERSDKKDLDGDGQVKSRVLKTHEVVMHDGTPIRRLIAQDDKPLSAEEQRSQEEGFRKAIEASARAPRNARGIRESRATHPLSEGHREFQTFGSAWPARRIGGRPAWVLDAEPQRLSPKDRYSLFTAQGRLVDQRLPLGAVGRTARFRLDSWILVGSPGRKVGSTRWGSMTDLGDEASLVHSLSPWPDRDVPRRRGRLPGLPQVDLESLLATRQLFSGWYAQYRLCFGPVKESPHRRKIVRESPVRDHEDQPASREESANNAPGQA